jgi:hypothetical protein
VAACRGHHVALAAVAPGQGAVELAVAVADGDGDPVELGLDGEEHRPVAATSRWTRCAKAATSSRS